jgi:hypothetical protein
LRVLPCTVYAAYDGTALYVRRGGQSYFKGTV